MMFLMYAAGGLTVFSLGYAWLIWHDMPDDRRGMGRYRRLVEEAMKTR